MLIIINLVRDVLLIRVDFHHWLAPHLMVFTVPSFCAYLEAKIFMRVHLSLSALLLSDDSQTV